MDEADKTQVHNPRLWVKKLCKVRNHQSVQAQTTSLRPELLCSSTLDLGTHYLSSTKGRGSRVWKTGWVWLAKEQLKSNKQFFKGERWQLMLLRGTFEQIVAIFVCGSMFSKHNSFKEWRLQCIDISCPVQTSWSKQATSDSTAYNLLCWHGECVR
jgi:hypothetical protein